MAHQFIEKGNQGEPHRAKHADTALADRVARDSGTPASISVGVVRPRFAGERL